MQQTVQHLLSPSLSHRLWAYSPSSRKSIHSAAAGLSLSRNRLIPFARPHFSQLCFFFFPRSPPSARRRLEKKINLAAQQRVVCRGIISGKTEREAECGRCEEGYAHGPVTVSCTEQLFEAFVIPRTVSLAIITQGAVLCRRSNEGL